MDGAVHDCVGDETIPRLFATLDLGFRDSRHHSKFVLLSRIACSAAVACESGGTGRRQGSEEQGSSGRCRRVVQMGHW